MRILAAAPGLLALLASAGCSRPPTEHDVRIQDVVTVTTAPAEVRLLPVMQAVHGTVRPVARARVASRLQATVQSTDFALGQKVVAGEILVRLAAAEWHARVDQAQARLAQAIRDHERELELVAKGAATEALVSSLAEARRIAKAALAENRVMLEYTEVRAPFDGVITETFVRAGDMATPGSPLFAIEGEDRFQAEVIVPGSLPDPGSGAKVHVWSGTARATGTLTEFSPAADPAARTRLAKIDLPAGVGFRSGEFVRADWPAGETPALLVPRAALKTVGQMETVFVVEDDVARLRLIKSGGLFGEAVHILAGLQAGERVIIRSDRPVGDGLRVAVHR